MIESAIDRLFRYAEMLIVTALATTIISAVSKSWEKPVLYTGCILAGIYLFMPFARWNASRYPNEPKLRVVMLAALTLLSSVMYVAPQASTAVELIRLATQFDQAEAAKILERRRQQFREACRLSPDPTRGCPPPPRPILQVARPIPKLTQQIPPPSSDDK